MDLLLLLTTLCSSPAFAQVPAEVAWGSAGQDAVGDVAPDATPVLPPPRELVAIGLFQTRATRSSIVSTNPFLNGQVVGALGGTNGTTTSLDDRATMVEQRAGAFLTWAPAALSGQAALTAAFEVDFVWGDQAYQSGGNTGGGFGADQVNLQTRRLYATFRPTLPSGHDLTVNTGLQFLADSAGDPHNSTADGLLRHGGGLAFWGSEAAGVSAHHRFRDGFGERLATRLGAFVLLENGVSLADDATLWAADAELSPAYAVDVGLHAWWLADRTGGAGGTLGVGPTSQLSELQGGPRLSFVDDEGLAAEVDADLLWLSADAGYNRDLTLGPVGLRGLFALNLGRLYVTDQTDVDVAGWLANGELRWRWTRGHGSQLSLQAMASSRDADDRDRYQGIVTGNSYGVVGAVWATHNTLLLFPDPQGINRQVALVPDVSNGGRGLVAATGTLGYDPVPDRLTVRGTAATASTADGQALGTEVGGALIAHPLPLLDLGLHAAVLPGARVLADGAYTDLPAYPWTVLAHLQWILFDPDLAMIGALFALAGCAARYDHLPPLAPDALYTPLPAQTLVLDMPDVGGVRIHYSDSVAAGITPQDGDAPPLVFVHGLSSYMGFWEYQLDHFAGQRRVLALDLPGYGSSSRPDAPCTPPWYADVLDAWLTQLGIDEAVIVGHSMGGQIALTFALQHPDAVAGLVLSAPAGIERLPAGGARWMKGYWHEGRAMEAGEEQLRATFTRMVFNHPDDGVERLLRERVQLGRHPDFGGTSVAVSRSIAGMVDHPVVDRLGEISAPTLLVFGTHDRMIPNPVFTGGRTATIARAGKAAIPGAQLVMLDGAGHTVHHDDPAGFNEAVGWFLAGSVRAASLRNERPPLTADMPLADGGPQ